MRLPVSAVEVTVADASWPSQFQAQTAGSRAVEVRARVQGIIEKRLYNEGDFVKAGQQLFQLERDQYEAQMQQALEVVDAAHNRIAQDYGIDDAIERRAASAEAETDAIADYEARFPDGDTRMADEISADARRAQEQEDAEPDAVTDAMIQVRNEVFGDDTANRDRADDTSGAVDVLETLRASYADGQGARFASSSEADAAIAKVDDAYGRGA